MLTRVLIANRGEIAVRIIRTCKEMGIGTIAVFSEADRTAPHVAMADEAHCIGPAPSRESYLSQENIIDVARRTHADAIHPGYGFLSENPVFAERVEKEGLIFVGPTANTITAMGDKTAARALMMRHGIPVVPGTGTIESAKEAEEFATRSGYPVLLKAAAGGGGKGMRVVHTPADLERAFAGAQAEARSAFGDGRIYVEKYLTSPRHIEFQILADNQGTIVHLNERECSIQRRHQKIVEESPSALLDNTLRSAMGETAVRAARACGYRNAGTIEFLVDGEQNYYFLEMNTRLQVEHPVTELVTGLDLVALQLRIAMGQPLPFGQNDVRLHGHAIECRISAEDAAFLPSTGTITHLRAASGPGVREDRGVEEGGTISVYYDPMIAKLIVWGATRDEAIARMKRALREYEVLGVKTNIPVCMFIMNHPDFVRGAFTTYFMPTQYSPEKLPIPDPNEERLAAALCVHLVRNNEQQGSGNGYDGSGNSPNGTVSWKQQRQEFLR